MLGVLFLCTALKVVTHLQDLPVSCQVWVVNGCAAEGRLPFNVQAQRRYQRLSSSNLAGQGDVQDTAAAAAAAAHVRQAHQPNISTQAS
jgi:hypothetical protein